MILIPQTIIRECHGFFRRVVTRYSMLRSEAVVHILGERDGIRIRLSQPDIAIEYHHPSPTESFSLTIPMTALADCEGRGSGTVQIERAKAGKVELRWDHVGVPCHREYTLNDASQKPFPPWPSRDSANDPSLLDALDEAMQIPTGGSGRLSLMCIQLRGKQGEVVATDGRQLLIQGGFQFPWKEAVLLPRTPIFGSKELSKGEVVRVAKSETHVHFRIGGWTIALAIETSTRFPNVDAVIPKPDQAIARWHVNADEASALAAMLDKLPAAKEEHAPVTLDLARPVVIRARGEDEKRCTDVALPRSRIDGKTLRVAVNRRYLQQALRLGFRSVLITGPDKPLMCQEGKRMYVCVPIDSTNALAPQANALRVMLPAMAQKTRRTTAVPEPVECVVPTSSVSRAPLRSPLRAVDGFVNCVRSLWDLVREHHRKERVQ